jgi:hypothetical protein
MSWVSPFTAANKKIPLTIAGQTTPLSQRGKIFDCVDDLFAELHVDCLGAFAPTVWFGLERDTRSFVQRRKTRTLQRGDVKKHILAAIVRRDKAEPARMIEEFDRPGLTHGKLLSPSKWSAQHARKIRQV